jgi:hypothetical protein
MIMKNLTEESLYSTTRIYSNPGPVRGTTRGRLVDKHCVVPIFQLNGFCKILKSLNTERDSVEYLKCSIQYLYF